MMYKWNGETCEAKPVVVKILPGDGMFMWWQPYVGKYLLAMQVLYNGKKFCMYDGDGSATRKLMNGGGPNMPHKGFENYEVMGPEMDVQVEEFRVCVDHKWSDDKAPIFATTTRYCIHCRHPEILDKLKGGK